MKKIIRFTIILLIAIMMILLGKAEVHAALQSNLNTQYTTPKKPPDWITQIRQMENPNNALGLSEETNSDLTFKNQSNMRAI